MARIVQGAIAGAVGALAMSISTNVEMRLRGRAPSDAPAKALGRVLGVNARGKHRTLVLGAIGHIATSVSLGTVRGVLARAGVGRVPASAALYGLALAPEVVAVPALGATDPPWKWSAPDLGISLLHHGVFAVATGATYELLEERHA